MRGIGFFVQSTAAWIALLVYGCSPDLSVPVEVPTLSSVSPALGPTAGEIELTLDGENFLPGAKVQVDGAEAAQVSEVSTSRIKARLPARPGMVGPVSVVVINPNGDTASRSNLFSYYSSQLDFTGSLFPINVSPNSVVVDDFDGDKKLDLATANSGGDTVWVLLGNGLGSIAVAAEYFVGKYPMTVVVADFNNDGKRDLATANLYGSSVSVLLGTGLGRFTRSIDTTVTESPISLAVGDFNRDEKPDVAVVHRKDYRDNVSVLLGDGMGKFKMQSVLSVDGRPLGVTIADFNADGRSDLAVVSTFPALSIILLGDGTGGFSRRVSLGISLGTEVEPSSITAGDLNHDEKVDLVVSDFKNQAVGVLLGDGAGGFSAIKYFPVLESPQSIAIADLDGDHEPDLLVSNLNESSVSVLLGDGTGNFSAAKNFAVGANPWSVVVGNFDRDQKLDFAVTSRSGVGIFLNTSL